MEKLDPRLIHTMGTGDLQAGAEGGVGVGGGGWGDDGLAPRAIRCQWRCAQRSAGPRTAVTVNGRPRDSDPAAGRGRSAQSRDAIGRAGSQQERSGRPRPIISSLVSHHKLFNLLCNICSPI
jgi:hypothetical protein